MPSTILLLSISVFVGCAIFAAISDARTLKIPNSISLIILVFFGVYALEALTPASAFTSLALSGITLAAGFMLYRSGLLGAGDAKLLAACMAWAGTANGFTLLAVTGIAGGVLAVALMLPVTARVTAGLQRGWPVPMMGTNGKPARSPMPYGIAIATGALVVAGRVITS